MVDSGSFDGTGVKRTFTLNRPYQGLLMVPGIWRELNNFSSGLVCLVLVSHEYDERDYISRLRCFFRILRNNGSTQIDTNNGTVAGGIDAAYL